MEKIIAKWLLEDEIGHALFIKEQRFINAILKDGIGELLIELGSVKISPYLQQNNYKNTLYLGQTYDCDVIAATEELPLATDSVDVVVCCHSLEYSADKKKMLKEVARILKPQGFLILLAFNPHPLWFRNLSWKHENFIEKHQCLPLSKLTNILRQQSLEIIAGKFIFYSSFSKMKLPIVNSEFLEKAGDRWWPQLSKVYGLVAQKSDLQLINVIKNNKAASRNMVWVPVTCRKPINKIIDSMKGQ